MVDIVERLRDGENENIFSTADEGADEIERLRGLCQSIHRTLAPGNRNLDEMLRDMGLADDLARSGMSDKGTKADG